MTLTWIFFQLKAQEKPTSPKTNITNKLTNNVGALKLLKLSYSSLVHEKQWSKRKFPSIDGIWRQDSQHIAPQTYTHTTPHHQTQQCPILKYKTIMLMAASGIVYIFYDGYFGLLFCYTGIIAT